MAAHARGLAEGQIFHIITRGQGIMPSHAVQVLPEDRWRVVLYLSQMQGTLPPTAESITPPAASSKALP
jgi:hypothetical protein